MGTFAKPNPGAAMLAASDVASLRQLGDTDYEETYHAAARRIGKLFPKYFAKYPPKDVGKKTAKTSAEQILDAAIQFLQDSRLTINFRAFRSFYWESTRTEYMSYWTAGTTGASPDKARRDKIEGAIGNYAAPSPLAPEGVAQGRVDEVQKRLKNLASQGERYQFQAQMRPRYAALDFAQCPNAAASRYGKSFYLLRPFLKFNATYLWDDSFVVETELKQETAKDKSIAVDRLETTALAKLSKVVSTYHSFARLLLHCPERYLQAIVEFNQGEQKLGKVLSLPWYVEAQLHSAIEFSRDVESICVSLAEVNSGPGQGQVHPRAGSTNWVFDRQKTTWDADDTKRVKKHIYEFAARYGLSVIWVP